MISDRAFKSLTFPNLLYDSWKKYQDNPFHGENNRDGIVNLGTAENNMMHDMVQEKLLQCALAKMDESFAHYCDMSGTEQFRNQLRVFFNHFMKPKTAISSTDLHVVNGCGVAIETLGFLLCDPGDGVLIPAPYYKAFDADLCQRFSAKIYPVPSSVGSNFKIDIKSLESVCQEATEQGCNIKVLLISNPYNPVGVAYDRKDLKVFLEFCLQKNIHFICDEVYMLSVYDNKANFVNLLALDDIHKYRSIIHIVWGFSKDFAVSGFRCGVIITFNEAVKKALKAQAYYTSVSTVTQFILCSFISDLDWLEAFMTTNHKRLLQARNVVVEYLTALQIPYVLPYSGLFIIFNASTFLADENDKGEWELFVVLLQNGVYVVPGSHLEFSEPGWFRIVISNKLETLAVGLNRINMVLKSHSKQIALSPK